MNIKSTLLFAALVVATLGTAQADPTASGQTGEPPVSAFRFGSTLIQCTPHEGLLGGADGQDCHLTNQPGPGGATLRTIDMTLWCNSTMCKGTGQAELQSSLAQGFPGGFPGGTHLRLALDCVSPPASGGPLLCKEAVEIGKAK
jgi:hypothetical protein